MAGHHDVGVEQLGGALDDALGLIRGDVGQEHGELVTGEPGDEVVDAHRPRQPAGHFHQQRVAGEVPELVVDQLELVEVDQHHRASRPSVSTSVSAARNSVRLAMWVRVVRRLVGEGILRGHQAPERLPPARRVTRTTEATVPITMISAGTERPWAASMGDHGRGDERRGQQGEQAPPAELSRGGDGVISSRARCRVEVVAARPCDGQDMHRAWIHHAPAPAPCSSATSRNEVGDQQDHEGAGQQEHDPCGTGIAAPCGAAIRAHQAQAQQGTDRGRSRPRRAWRADRSSAAAAGSTRYTPIRTAPETASSPASRSAVAVPARAVAAQHVAEADREEGVAGELDDVACDETDGQEDQAGHQGAAARQHGMPRRR